MSRSNTFTTGPTRAAPVWAGDFGNREHLVPGGAKLDAAQFARTDAVVVTVGAAGAAANATTVPVDPLSGPIPAGATIKVGVKKYLTLTVAAAAAAVSLTVEALATAVVDNDTGTYPGDLSLQGAQYNMVPGGTPVGRTLAERNASTGFGPADAADDEVYFTWLDVLLDETNDVELYRHHGIVKENFLPIAFSSLAAGVQTKLRALYTMTRGAE